MTLTPSDAFPETGPMPLADTTPRWRDTLASLQVPNFRLYTFSNILAMSATAMQRIALDWLVFELTHSVAAVGLTVAFQSLPMLLFGLWGGVLVDRYSKRMLMMCTQSTEGGLSALLAVLAMTEVIAVWHVYTVALIVGFVTVIDYPTRQVLVNEIVGPRNLKNAISVNSSVFQLGGLIGPAVASILMLGGGAGWAFAVNALACAATVVTLSQLRTSALIRTPPIPPAKGQLRQGIRYSLSKPVILWPLVMLAFLHSLRNSFIVLVAIPASIVSTFIAMYLLDFSLNMMSLLALSLSVGILVDDSIVVIENIYRHIEKGKDKITASITGRNEIGFTALSITLVDVSVFLPMSIVQNIVSGVIRQFSLVIVVATLISLFVSFTLTPLMASRIAKLDQFNRNSFLKHFADAFESFINRFSQWLEQILRWSFTHKFVVLISVTLLFIGSVSLIPFGFIGSEFVDLGDRGEIIIQMELPKYATLEQTNNAVRKVENILLENKEVSAVLAQVGGTSDITDIAAGANKAEITLKLVSKENRKYGASVYAQLLKNELSSKIAGVKFVTSIVSPVGGSDQVPVQVAVKCANPDTLIKYARIVLNEAKRVQGTSDVKFSTGEPSPELQVKINRQKMSDLGLTMGNVGPTMQIAFSGNTDTKFRQGEYEYDINLKYDQFNRQNISDVSGMSFLNNSGKLVRLDQFAEIRNSMGASKIERDDRVTSITVHSQVFGRALGDVGNDIKQQLKLISFPKEVSIAYEGDLKAQSDSFGSLGFALVASIVFIYLLMVVLYESYLYPLIVLCTIPLAIVGALMALAFTGNTLSIITIMGLIMLMGLVAKNAILVVDFTNQIKRQGYSTTDALCQATSVRLRPILMTTLSMIIAMLPIALATGPGSVWKNGLAWVLVGGLSSSLFLSLIIVPVVYYIAERGKEKTTEFIQKYRIRHS